MRWTGGERREKKKLTHWTKTLRENALTYFFIHLNLLYCIVYAAPKCCRIAAPARIKSKRYTYVRKQNKNKNSFGREKERMNEKKNEQYLVENDRKRTNEWTNKWTNVEKKKMHNQKKRSTKYNNIRINCFRFH